MRPGTKFVWHDESGIQKTTPNVPVMPLYLVLTSSDKGPEDLRRTYGAEFYKLYGNDISFNRHGQPLLQAANIIDNGGELLIKRLVADDATLANAAVVAKVKKEQVQKINADGQPLYIDKVTGEETTTAEDNEKAVINTASITYDVLATTNVKTLQEVQVEVLKHLDEAGTDDVFSYPLYIVTDNGRGKSEKRFNITPNYSLSKNINFAMYELYNISNMDNEVEKVRFSTDPDIIYLDNSMSLSMTGKDLLQLRAITLEDSVTSFVNKIAEMTGVAKETLSELDILFGCDRKGNKLNYIAIDTENGFNLAEELGIPLLEGKNGTFGDKPFANENWIKQAKATLNGTFDDSIYDVDRYKIDLCVDANYPLEVKKEIIALAQFREDFSFIGDLGLNNDTYDLIKMAYSEVTKDKFADWYCQYGDIIDPFTKKQITVTLNYGIAAKSIGHLNANRNAPMCGAIYNITFPEFIEGTVNFIPKITPKIDQKTEFDDLHLNFASYLNGVLTMETAYTSQTPYTQLSYSNNIFAIQKIMHIVRDACPKFRYTFSTTDDLENYAQDVQKVLDQYSEGFEVLEFVYTQDDAMQDQKIFEASIKFKFKNFIQSEIFHLYALSRDAKI